MPPSKQPQPEPIPIEADRPPFVASQSMRILLDTDNPQRYLRAEHFRANRPISAGGPELDLGPWDTIDRDALADNSVRLDDSECDLSRLVFTTDAGMGKTVNLRWLHARLNRAGVNTLAFFIPIGELPASISNLVATTLVTMFRQPQPDLPEATAVRMLTQLQDEGRLVLLLDALDQVAGDSSAITALRQLIDDPKWQACRIVISGRPHALQRHWEKLFADHPRVGWRFVQLDEFTPEQQREFLGNDEHGTSRYDRIPDEAREILSVPRVLEYLRKLPTGELSQVRTPSDVYFRAIGHMLTQAMKNSPHARMIGLASTDIPEQVQARSLRAAWRLLSAIAFEMTSMTVATDKSDAAAGDQVARGPNFDRVDPNRFDRFKRRLAQRLAAGRAEVDMRLLEQDLDSLTAMNTILAHGFFDTDVSGLDQILWRNRSLQEFFTAYWMSQYIEPHQPDRVSDRLGTRGRGRESFSANDSSAANQRHAEKDSRPLQADDIDRLWNWLPLPARPVTEEYTWVWRFACEMPANAIDPEAWPEAMEPLFRPGDGTPEGTRRSCEMIYRAWPQMQRLADEGEPAAARVLREFLGEFENEILAGNRSDAVQQVAQEFRDSFIDLPAGEFQMGSPPEKQGMPDVVRQQWEEYLESEGEPEELAAQHVSQIQYPPTKQGKEWRDSIVNWWTRVFREQDLEAVVSRLYASNETPYEPVQAVDAYQLGRTPVLNGWWRLFDPGHGQSNADWYADQYAEISAEDDTPAIYVNWYDAWVFSRWAQWDRLSCRLPQEHEWEYAAKAGTQWDWNYWWGNEFDAAKCNADRKVGRTTAPGDAFANPWGFIDILGNVWEWCANRYQLKYSRDEASKHEHCVLRGGSWNISARKTRSAIRSDLRPSVTYSDVGFRLARALFENLDP